MIRACSIDDVPMGEGRALTLHARRIAVFRTPTGWYAVDNACPHAGGPLADGVVADQTVICPLHDRRFDLATGEVSGGGEGIACYAIEVRGQEVFVDAAAAATATTSSLPWRSADVEPVATGREAARPR
jgi:nitrite reductase (NADH) small subunit